MDAGWYEIELPQLLDFPPFYVKSEMFTFFIIQLERVMCLFFACFLRLFFSYKNKVTPSVDSICGK